MIVLFIVAMIVGMIVPMIVAIIVAIIYFSSLWPLTLPQQQWPTYSVAEFLITILG